MTQPTITDLQGKSLKRDLNFALADVTLKLVVTTAISPAILLGSVAVEDAHDQMIVDATTRGIDLQEIVVMMGVTTEDHQIVEVIPDAANGMTVVTSDALSVGHAAVTTALAEIDATTARVEADATIELIVAEAPLKKESVTKRSAPTRHTAGATTAIQVNNKNKNRRPHNPSDANFNQDYNMLTFAYFRIPSPR